MAVLTSLITYVPPKQWLGIVLPLIFCGGAMLSAALALVLGRLPASHWAQQSRPGWALLVAFVLAMLILFGVLIG